MSVEARAASTNHRKTVRIIPESFCPIKTNPSTPKATDKPVAIRINHVTQADLSSVVAETQH